MSVIYFGSSAKHTVTSIIRNADDAAKFADEGFFDPERKAPRPVPDLGPSTNMISAYDTAGRLFDHENDYGFQAMTRSVVIAGDGEQSGMADGEAYVAGLTEDLGRSRNAVVYGIPIVSETEANLPSKPLPGTLSAWYASAVATPKGLSYIGQGQPVPLRTGASIPSAGFAGIERAVTTAIRLNMF